MTTQRTHVFDVDESTFERDVIARSYQTPVVVDFWAAWCGPCRMLGPILERLAEQGNGAFELAKLDTDHNPQIAAQFRIQGIPAVKAFRDGQVVSEFTGALPEPQVRAWLSRIVPSEAEKLVQEGRAASVRGDVQAAERSYRQALAQDRNLKSAAIGLAGVLASKRQFAEAEELLRPYPADEDAQRAMARLRFGAAAQDADFVSLNQRVAADPKDPAAHLALGLALAGDEAYTSALDHLLESVRLDRHHSGDAARKALLDLFALLGEDDPRTQQYRRQLSSVLF